MNALRKVSLLLIPVLLTACNHKDRDDIAETFISKFKSVKPDTLRVYSDEEYTDYQGTAVDSIETIFFPKKIVDAHFAAPPGIFACYKFEIDKTHLGLIARTPSLYDASSLKFFIYNKKSNSLSIGFELAENLGGIVNGVQKNAWIYKNPQGKPEALVWTRFTKDKSAGSTNDYQSESVDKFCIVNLSNERFDTLNTNARELTKQFSKQLEAAHLWRE